MELIIDNRELAIKKYFEDNKNYENVKYENMDIGDLRIEYNNKLICIFERKTIEDFAASIKDGRYREQKQRLIDNCSKEKIIYLIEGDLTSNNSSYSFNKVSKDTIYSSIINLYLRDNINMFHSNSVSETIEFILQFYKKIDKQGLDFLNNKSTYQENLLKTKSVKKDNMTPEIVFKSQLCCIAGVSSTSAHTLFEKFNTIQNMITELNKLSAIEQKKLISNLTYTTTTNKTRKLGPKLTENLLINLGYTL